MNKHKTIALISSVATMLCLTASARYTNNLAAIEAQILAAMPPPPAVHPAHASRLALTLHDLDGLSDTDLGPIPYPYTLQNLGPNDAPVLQWMDSQNLMVNCNSNEVCYLTHSYDLTIPTTAWPIIATVTNGEAINISGTATKEFFQLRVVQTRFVLAFIPDVNGDLPTGLVYLPDWQAAYGSLYVITNMPDAYNGCVYGLYSNTVVNVFYPASATNATASWPFVTIYEFYTDTNANEICARSNTIVMPAKANATLFEISAALNGASGSSGSGPAPHMVECWNFVPSKLPPNAATSPSANDVMVSQSLQATSPDGVGTNSDAPTFPPGFQPVISPTIDPTGSNAPPVGQWPYNPPTGPGPTAYPTIERPNGIENGWNNLMNTYIPLQFCPFLWWIDDNGNYQHWP